MSFRAHVVVALLTALAIGFILRLVRRRQLRAKYSLLWLAVGLALIPLAAWPGLLESTSDRLGVFYPPVTFLLAAVAFLFLVVVHFSWELSRLEERTRTLAEDLALLRAEVRLAAQRADVTPPSAKAGEPTTPLVGSPE